MRLALQDIVAELESMSLILEATGDQMSRYLLDILLEECREAIWRLSDEDETASEHSKNPEIRSYPN